MADGTRAKVFWSGGSQAVRLPKAMRLPGREVRLSKRGSAVIIEPLPDGDDWEGFWDGLVELRKPVKRWKTGAVDRRKPL